MNLHQNPPPATAWNKARSPFIRYPSQGSPWSVVKPLDVKARLKAKREFVEWLDHQNPRLLQKATEIAKRKMNGMGAYMEPNPNAMLEMDTLGYTPLIPRFSQDMNIRRDVMDQGLGQAWPSMWEPTPTFPTGSQTIPEEKAEEGWLNKVIDAASTIAPAYLQFQQQKEILDMQLERAKQGLPPLETAYLAPTIRIQPELSPEARQAVTTGIQNLALPVLLIGGVALLATMGRRRRR